MSRGEAVPGEGMFSRRGAEVRDDTNSDPDTDGCGGRGFDPGEHSLPGCMDVAVRVTAHLRHLRHLRIQLPLPG